MSRRRYASAPAVPSLKTAGARASDPPVGRLSTVTGRDVWGGFQNTARLAPLAPPTTEAGSCGCQEEAGPAAPPRIGLVQGRAPRSPGVSSLSVRPGRATNPRDPWRAWRGEGEGGGGVQPAAGKGGCGCDGGPKPRPRRPTRDRIVSGDWLIALLGADDEVPPQLAGASVRVTGEAWWALKAIQQARQDWPRRQREVERARATDWPRGALGKGAAPTEVRAELLGHTGRSSLAVSDGPCGCTDTIGRPGRSFALKTARFVSGKVSPFRSFEASDDNDGRLRVLADPTGGDVPYVLVLSPWRSLRRVERWLNDDIYGLLGTSDPTGICVKGAVVFLRRGYTWDGSEEPSTSTSDWSDAPADPFDWSNPTASRRSTDYSADLTRYEAILVVNQFKGLRDYPLLIGAYGPATDGSPTLLGSSAEVQYGDERVALQFVSCCNVHVMDLKLQGFGIGVDVRGGCQYHIYSKLEICDQAIYGVRIGVREDDLEDYAATEDSSATELLIAAGMFPRAISIIACTLYSNGYDTEGADISLGYLAESCDILSNTLYGYDPTTGVGLAADGSPKRGVDGVVANGPSSGHLIDGNTIYLHNKGSYVNDRQKTVLAQTSLAASSSSPSICGTTTLEWVLLHGWEDGYETDTTTECGTATDYGFAAYYLNDLTGDESTTLINAYASPTADDDVIEAFGEDGIDLKGVRNRTTDDDTMVTVVRNNKIYGHDNHAGICINDGSTNIHIYNNYLALNAVGILVTNSPNHGDWYENLDTSSIYIYRNVVYLNTGYGVQVSSYKDDSEVVYKVNGVYLVNNTIAHNYYNGVRIAIDVDDDEPDPASHVSDVDGIYLYNNLIARNGVGETWKHSALVVQIVWDNLIDLAPGVRTAIESDYNTYLGWDRKDDGSMEAVVVGYSSAVSATTAYEASYATVKELQTTTTSDGSALAWGVERNSLQAEDYDELEIDEDGLLFGSSGLELDDSRGTYCKAYFWGLLDLPALATVGGVDGYAAGYAIKAIVTSSSLLVDMGTTTRFSHYATGSDIATSPDIVGSGDSSGSPDIGAYVYLGDGTTE